LGHKVFPNYLRFHFIHYFDIWHLCSGSHAEFLHDIARPHPGQIEVAHTIRGLLDGSKFAYTGEEKEKTIDEDVGTLRQDRYALRTSPQFLGPQLEDILLAVDTVTIECNSSQFGTPITSGFTLMVGGHSHGQSSCGRCDQPHLPWR
jgi:histidine ammonia-lyase